MSVSTPQRGRAIARLAAPPVAPAAEAMTGPLVRSVYPGSGYPWHDGELLYAADLNAAIAASAATIVDVRSYGAVGDGVTNDYNALQSALNDSAPGSAIIYIPDTGHPYMTNGLVVWSGTHLVIDGTLKLIGGSNISLININNASNITIRGRGVLDANMTAQSSYAVGTLGGDNNTNIQIEGLTLQNAYSWNLNITGSSNVIVDRVRLLGGQNSNEFAAGCDNCWITNSYINGPSGDGGFSFYGGVDNSGMTNCIVTGSYATGIGVYSDAAQPAPCFNIIIANNIIHDCQTGAITVDTDGSSPVAGVVQTGITISGNRCYNNVARNQQYGDIWIGRGVGVTITGNNLSGSGVSTPTGVFACGIFLGVTSSHINVIGNTIWNEGNSGSGTGYGIYLQQAPDVLVEGNVFYDDQTTHTMINAIAGDAGTRNQIIGNQFGLLGGSPIGGSVIKSDTIASNGGIISNSLTVSGALAVNGGGSWTGELDYNGTGIHYNGGNGVAFTWTGSQALNVWIDGTSEGTLVGSPGGHAITFTSAGTTLAAKIDATAIGNMLTDTYFAAAYLATGGLRFTASPTNAGNDAAAATAGVPVGGIYRNGSVLMVRVT